VSVTKPADMAAVESSYFGCSRRELARLSALQLIYLSFDRRFSKHNRVCKEEGYFQAQVGL
jgi:hypothetical protein